MIAPTAAYFSAALALGLAAAAIGPSLMAFAAQTDSSVGSLGVIFAAHSFGHLAGAWWAGRALDRQPGHRLIALALFTMALVLVQLPAAPVRWLLALALLCLGLTAGLIDVGSNTLLLWLHSARPGGPITGLHFFFGVGSLAAPALVAWSLQTTGSIASAYGTMAALVAGVGCSFLRLRHTSQPIRRVVPTSQAPGRLVVLIAGVYALYSGVEVGFGGWIVAYAAVRGFGTASETAYFASLFWAALTAGRIASVPLADRFSPTLVIGCGLLGALLSGATVLVLPSSRETLLAATGSIGFFLAPIFPTLLVFSGSRVGNSGRNTGWYIMGAGAGGMVLPWAVGECFAAMGPSVLMWLVEIALLLGAGIFAVASALPARAPACRAG